MAVLRQPSPSLEGLGTPEALWSACDQLRRLSASPVAVPISGRVVVVAPHPDDEVLGAGGTTAALVARGARIFLVSVTDGEASDPGRAEELRRIRPRESARAAARLGTTPHGSLSLRLPDGGVRADDVEAVLTPVLEPGDLVLAPWARDGHPDHDETGLAAERACREAGADLLAYLVWAWHWAQPSDLPWGRLRRVDFGHAIARRKRRAVRSFSSQVSGPEPILSRAILCRLTRDFEVFVNP